MIDLLSAPEVAKAKPTSTDIRKALLSTFAPPSHRVFFEVSSDTGARVTRHIDAVAFGIWPSAGYEIIGIEIKVSRGDWLRELADPAKAQELMRFCSRWYLACPDGLVRPDELPRTWGMLTLKDGALKRKVVGPVLAPQPITPGFLMAVLRQANGIDAELVERLVSDKLADRSSRIDDEINRGVDQRARDNAHALQKAIEVRDKIKDLTGESLTNFNFDVEAFAATYRFMRASGLHKIGVWRGALPEALTALSGAHKKLQELYDDPIFAAARAPNPDRGSESDLKQG